jgi:mRNA interferase MazF
MSRAGLQRGDVVVVNFTPTNPNATVRPALVIQNDLDNNRMANTIVVQITSNTRRAAEDTQLLIDQSHPDWSAAGLHRPSVVNCSNIATVKRQDVLRSIGSLSDATMAEIDCCIKAALGIQ